MRAPSSGKPFQLFLSFLCVGVLSLSAFADEWTGLVVGVSDGDTIEVMRDGKAVRVRLYGIDCPESGQAFGSLAKQFTSDAAFSKDVRVVVQDTDHYGRIVGDVYLADGTRLNASLITAGLAWWYKEYAPDDIRLQRRHLDASTRRVGLWSESNPIPPWEYRNGKRAGKTAQAEQLPEKSPSRSTTPSGGTWDERTVYITRTGGKYHLDGCPSLVSSKIPALITEAAEVGYTPCSICKPPAVATDVQVQSGPVLPPVIRAPPVAVPNPAQRVQARPVPRRAPSSVSQAPAQEEREEVTVYVTRTGEKYHQDGCQYLRQSRIPMGLGAAKEAGYTACSRCGPPR